MLKPIFWVIFGLSSIAYATGCRCPDLDNLKDPRKDVPCPCSIPYTYMDVTSGRCVRYFDCPFYDFLDESNIQNNGAILTGMGLDEELDRYVRRVFTLTNGSANPRTFYETVMSEFPVQPIMDAFAFEYNETTLRNSPDIALIKEDFEEEVKGSFENLSRTYASIFNPFIMSNKRINAKCDGKKGCVWYDIFERNSIIIGVEMSRFFGNFTSRSILFLDKIDHKAKEFCEQHRCVFLPELMQYREFLQEFLENCRLNRANIVRNVIKRIRNSREDNVKLINSYVDYDKYGSIKLS